MLEHTTIQNEKIVSQIFSHLHVSQEMMLSEVALLLASQQASEWRMHVEYFKKKYGKNFQEFDRIFQTQNGSYETENDWMDWKFASESYEYWKSILEQMQ